MSTTGRALGALSAALVTLALTGTGTATGASPAAAPDATPAQQILRLTNEARADAGCPPLRLDPALNEAALGHSTDMAENDFFDHVGSDGSEPADRAEAAGYQWSAIGENIAAGNDTATATFDQWMNSEGHRANILNCDYTDLGVGYAQNSSSQYTHYWTQDFGSPW